MPHIPLTPPEWKLMNALWRGAPATAREIQERLGRDAPWAYTTIKTMLSRLVAKGTVSEHKRGNLSFYEPLLARRQARLLAVRSLAEAAFEGAFGPLMHFLIEEETLSPGEKRKLRALLREQRGGKRDDQRIE